MEQFKPAGGFIVLSSGDKNKKKEEVKKEGGGDENKEELAFYDQFHPSVLLPDFENSKTVQFPTLNEAVDDFFSKIESQNIDMQQMNKVCVLCLELCMVLKVYYLTDQFIFRVGKGRFKEIGEGEA